MNEQKNLCFHLQFQSMIFLLIYFLLIYFLFSSVLIIFVWLSTSFTQFALELSERSLTHFTLQFLDSGILLLLDKHGFNAIQLLLHLVHSEVHIVVDLIKHVIHLEVDTSPEVIQVVNDLVLFLSHGFDTTNPLTLVIIMTSCCSLNESMNVHGLTLNDLVSQNSTQEEQFELSKIVDDFTLGFQISRSLSRLNSIIFVRDNRNEQVEHDHTHQEGEEEVQ